MRDENDGDGCYGTTSVRYIHKGFLGFTRNTYAGISFTPFLKTFLRVTRWMCLGEEALHELFNFLFYAFISVRNSEHDGFFFVFGD